MMVKNILLKKIGGGATGVYARSATFVVAASDSEDTTNADYVCDGTADEVQINTAIAALSDHGGTVMLMDGTYNLAATISMNQAGVALIGCGRSTKLYMTNSTNLSMISLAAANCLMRDFLIDMNGGNNTSGKGINITATSNYVKIIRVDIEKWAQSTSSYGIYATAGMNYYLIAFCRINSTSDYRYGKPIYFNTNCQKGTIIGNQIDSRGGAYGIYFKGQYSSIIENNIGADQSPYTPIYFSGGYNKITGNICRGGLASGKVIEGYGMYDLIANNSLLGSGYYGIYTGSYGCLIIGHRSFFRYPVYLTATADYSTVTGNNFSGGSSYGVTIESGAEKVVIAGNNFRYGRIVDNGTNTQIFNNSGLAPVQERMFRTMKNTSGGALAVGDLVVMKAVAGGDEVTTTTTQGDDMVVGMAAAVIADTAYGLIQVLGKTVVLKVDGTIDIAIGDFIGTFTTAGIGMKAAAGDMAIAIALEAYATDDSSGVIDALLITPRKI